MSTGQDPAVWGHTLWHLCACKNCRSLLVNIGRSPLSPSRPPHHIVLMGSGLLSGTADPKRQCSPKPKKLLNNGLGPFTQTTQLHVHVPAEIWGVSQLQGPGTILSGCLTRMVWKFCTWKCIQERLEDSLLMCVCLCETEKLLSNRKRMWCLEFRTGSYWIETTVFGPSLMALYRTHCRGHWNGRNCLLEEEWVAGFSPDVTTEHVLITVRS